MTERLSIILRLTLLFLVGSALSFAPTAYSVTEKTANLQSAYVVENYNTQMEILISLVTELPWWKSLWEKAAVAAYYAEDYKSAKTAFEKAEIRNALSAQGSLLFGDVYLKNNDPGSAETVWQDLESNPDAVNKIRHTVAKIEKKLLLNVARKDLRESDKCDE